MSFVLRPPPPAARHCLCFWHQPRRWTSELLILVVNNFPGATLQRCSECAMPFSWSHSPSSCSWAIPSTTNIRWARYVLLTYYIQITFVCVPRVHSIVHSIITCRNPCNEWRMMPHRNRIKSHDLSLLLLFPLLPYADIRNHHIDRGIHLLYRPLH